MSAPDDFTAYCAELLSAAGEVRSRRMFGGHGLYLDDVFVAIIVRDVLYLKADDESRPRFEAAGGRRFEYERRGQLQGTNFWSPPAEAMDSPALMRPWVQLAVDAALRVRARNRPRQRLT